MLYWFTAQVFHWQLEHHAKHYLALVKVEGCTRQSSVMFITQHHYFYTPPFVAFLRFTRPRVAAGDGIIISLDEWAGIMFMLRWVRQFFSGVVRISFFCAHCAHTLYTKLIILIINEVIDCAPYLLFAQSMCVCVMHAATFMYNFCIKRFALSSFAWWVFILLRENSDARAFAIFLFFIKTEYQQMSTMSYLRWT